MTAALLYTKYPLPYINPEIGAQSGQSVGKAIAYGVKFPFSAMPVQLAHHHGGFNGKILPQIIPDQLAATRFIQDMDIRVGNLPEILAAGLRVVNGHGKGDFVHVSWHLGQIHLDDLVVAIAGAGEVVAGVGDAAAFMGRLL